jgi:hypothetical protein
LITWLLAAAALGEHKTMVEGLELVEVLVR